MGRLTLDEAAAELRTTKRWLNDWLRAHPKDAAGEPYYSPVGRNKIFRYTDIVRIENALREGLLFRSDSGRRSMTKHRISKYETSASESVWKLAADLTGDPSLNKCSAIPSFPVTSRRSR